MAGKRVRFHPEAEQEFLTSLQWYRERSLTAAVDFERAVTGAIENIALAPERWPSYFDQFRKYTLRQFPFSIVYEELLSEIVVFAVAHARRRPGYWKDRA
jgi:plasmid stabilization system protein ParE